MKLKIGILGTRGIPNHYGGFEQCAEHIAKRLSERGHEVYVYNSHKHPYKLKQWKAVNLIHCYDPEYKVGTFGQFVYDFNCLRDASKRKYDVLLQLGYTSNAIWFPIWPSNCPNVINMDGMEWKRSKYNHWVRRFLKYSEKLAANKGDFLIADSKGIQNYLINKYNLPSAFIPYGGIAFTNADSSLLPNGLNPYQYDLVIARMEKENNIECIISAFLNSCSIKQLVIVGGYENNYGRELHQKYSKHNNILFLGGIYELNILNNLRHYSHLYYHGHTVGGTNPSLIEAMASSAMIIAHKNDFNRKVLGQDAHFFNNEAELSSIIKKLEKVEKNSTFIANNLKKVLDFYNWENVTDQYEKALVNAVEEFNLRRSKTEAPTKVQLKP